MNKDFRLILDKAVELGVPMPATAAALHVNAARTEANGEETFSSVISEMELLARVHGNYQPAPAFQTEDSGSAMTD
jgi:hypothetical protein